MLDFLEVVFGALVGMFIGASMVVVVIYAAIVRDPSGLASERPKKLRSFTTDVPRDDALRRIATYALAGNLELHYLDEPAGILILASPVSIWTYGQFFPVYISHQGHETVVEVGAKSRTGFWNVLTASAHRRTTTVLEAVVKLGA